MAHDMPIIGDPQYRIYDLPPQLEAALQKFGKWSDDQLVREQNAVTPTTPLFHYTRREALKGILENRNIWCFSHDQQDDLEELQYSLELAGRELKRIAESGPQFASEFCNCVVDLLAKTYFANVFKFFLFSVSKNRDSARQWAKYAQNGTGFSIGFAPKLFRADQTSLSPRANENSHVGLVVYGDEKTIYRHRKVIGRATDITQRVAAANRNLLRSDSTHSDYINAMAKEYIARQLIWRCVTAKRSCWSYQSEVRFVVLNQTKNFEGVMETHTDGRNYIAHPLPLRDDGSIAEIMLGPNAPPDAEDWLRKLLAELGYPEIAITQSNARA